MARPGLTNHPKFLEFAHRLRIPVYAALGLLEFLWTTGYENGEPVIGSSMRVELASRWDGEPGTVTAAMLACGFIDLVDGERYEIHDFWDHAPEYVRRRASREAERQQNGKTLKDMRSEAGRKGGLAKAMSHAHHHGDVASVQQTSGNCLANVDHVLPHEVANVAAPAPAPAPAPALNTIPPNPPEGGEVPANEKPKRRTAAAAIVPPTPGELDAPEFHAAWSDWLAYRCERKLTRTPATLTAQLKKLARWGPEKAVRSLRNSIEQGYAGLFEVPEGRRAGGTNGQTDSEYVRQELAKLGLK